MMIPFPVPAELFPAEHRFADLGGARLHYVDEGTGEPILLLHGNPTWSFLYRKIIAGLSDEFRLHRAGLPRLRHVERPVRLPVHASRAQRGARALR